MNTGKLTFSDNLVPRAPQGTYRITVDHEVFSGDPAASLTTADQTVHVTGTRLALAEGDVHGVYPPRGAAGAYTDLLAHIALERRIIPWENRPAGEPAGTPWIALLLFGEGELLDDPHCLGEVEEGRAEDLLTPSSPPPDLALPAITLADDGEKKLGVHTVRTRAEVFKALVPSLDVLAYRTHVRSPLPGENLPRAAENEAERREQEYAFAVSDRLPAETGGRYVAHLVSLEGHEEHVRRKVGKENIRLLSLHSWTFTSTADTGARTFADIAERLVRPGKERPAELLLRPTAREADDPTAYTRHLAHRLENGWVPLRHLGDAEHDYVFYRGPLVPFPVESAARDGEWWRTTTDPYGVRETGHHAAWTLGRGLALADQEFSGALARHLARAHQTVLDLAAVFAAEPPPAPTGEEAGAPEAGGAPLAGGVLPGALYAEGPGAEALARVLAGEPVQRHWEALTAAAPEQGGAEEPPQGAAGGPASAEVSYEDLVGRLREGDVNFPSAAPPLQEAVQALTADTAVADTVAAYALLPSSTVGGAYAGGEEQAPGYEPALGAWLDGLRLLRPVPFDHLVPHASMLPVESLRLFRVDPDWLDALTRGALAAGLCLAHDPARITALWNAYEPHRTTPDTGLLIRSELVSAFPELRVEASAEQVGGAFTERCSVLRQDRIAPDILLVLFKGRPKTVSLVEPFHGLHLGVEKRASSNGEEDRVRLRSLDRADLGAVLPGDGGASAAVPYRSGTDTVDRVIDLSPTTGLPAALWSALPANAKPKDPAHPARTTPAELALQMVRSPERIEITVPESEANR
ncbi:hypothetical protein J0910_18430 [Nocardiopsis sp. CNT-189]|uniref:hypothetical protein n=1 Tax=Nocardiopsis oceanisediminis TaxID=2816862 RepID=UPI003B38843D